MQSLNIYRVGESWYFDDRTRGITKEPFVFGSSEIITEVLKRNGRGGDEATLSFSSQPFSKSIKLDWQKYQDKNWNQYYSSELKMYGWLCPVLYQYFESPPRNIYFSAT